MRVLLDECLPRKLKFELPGHEVGTVPEAGWKGLTNGELLRVAQGRFDVFVTTDRSLAHQRNLRDIRLAIVVLVARGSRFDVLQPLMPGVVEALHTIRPGEYVEIHS